MIIDVSQVITNEGAVKAIDGELGLSDISFNGMDISFTTTAKTDEEAKELLTRMGAPFAK